MPGRCYYNIILRHDDLHLVPHREVDKAATMEALVAPHRAKASPRHAEDVDPSSHKLDHQFRPGKATPTSRPPATEDLPPVEAGFTVDENVIAAFPDKDAVLISAEKSGESLWGATACLKARLPSGETDIYFLKVMRLGEIGRVMCHGEFESLKAVYKATPRFCPKPYAWGRYKDEESYFLLVEFRHVGHQPADASQLGEALANMHKSSQSPTGKFGFHMRTCHARIAQAVDFWHDSWCAVFKSHLAHAVDLAKPVLEWPEFNIVADLVVEKVVPRLLLPLQEQGRTLKPCLVHGNCWDGNTAMDAETGAPFIFDVCSFYGHNEYDIGNWRAPRHRLSREPYLSNYKDHFEVSPPEEEWDQRNLLYSLPYNIGNAIYVPGSDQRPVIFDDMKELCSMCCADELASALGKQNHGSNDTQILGNKLRRHSKQESDYLPSETGIETEAVEDEDDDEVEEEELDKTVIENLRKRGIQEASETCGSPLQSDTQNDASLLSGRWDTTRVDEPPEPAIVVEDEQGQIVDDSRQRYLPERMGTVSSGASRAAAVAATEEDPPVIAAPTSETDKRDPGEAAGIDKTIEDEDGDWEDVQSGGSRNKSAGGLRRRRRGVKRHKARVLSSW